MPGDTDGWINTGCLRNDKRLVGDKLKALLEFIEIGVRSLSASTVRLTCMCPLALQCRFVGAVPHLFHRQIADPALDPRRHQFLYFGQGLVAFLLSADQVRQIGTGI